MLRHSKILVQFSELLILIAGLIAAAVPALAAQTQSQPPAPAAAQNPAVQKKNGQYVLHTSTNLVVLHATVVNNKGQMIDDLGKPDFRVYENGIRQNLAVFSHSDVPVTMGIVIDDSGSMRDKRPSVDAAALTFVKTSNPHDQVFVVNFNDVYYVDTPGNFAANTQQLESALDKIDSRGGTALYDAVVASLDHLKLGNRDKKVLLVITDGDDNSSRYTFPELIQYAEKSNAVIYAIGLLGGNNESGGLFHIHSGGDRHAAKVLKEMAESTGGKAFFPKSLSQVDDICQHIAHEIRDQYTLAYYPTDAARDGTFRQVRVEAFLPNSHKHLTVRTRPGYFAPKGKQYANISDGPVTP
ncbi:MAG: VWA domain-containing protein, partial [Terriglobia bacterium]